MNPIARYLIAAIAAGVAMNIAALATFGPAQAILQNPDLQSAKFIAVFASEPPPRAAAFPLLFQLGIVGLGFVHALAFRLLYRGLPRRWIAAGLLYGVAAWMIALWCCSMDDRLSLVRILPAVERHA